MVSAAVMWTPAWLVTWRATIPGVLELRDGRIAFTTADTAVFDTPVAGAPIAFPWYTFAARMRITVGLNTYVLSFVRPRGAAAFPPGAATPPGTAPVTGREAGRAWRAACCSR